LSLVTSAPEAGAPRFEVVALTARSNVEALANAARRTGAQLAVVADESRYAELKERLAGADCEAAAGANALAEAGDRPADRVVAGIVGIAGLAPTLAAVRRGSTVALANKESMVCAGALLRREADRSGARLLPIDSEHNAIFQVLDRSSRVEKLILTASGGPFRCSSIAEMASATPEQACAHPNWSMGQKISVDSATMMNKGLELIEAVHLFDTPAERIEVLIHPQSIVHSLVAYDDGSVLAQLGMPDMRTPISYALAWPDRMPVPGLQRLGLAKIGRLDFEAADLERFPALGLARQAAQTGGAAPIVLNAANEVAVEAFLQRRTGFLSIADAVADALENLMPGFGGDEPQSIDAIMEVDAMARQRALAHLGAVA
jgi:1-deoxy-D-xylulose-5-phosphate reductoisomerase